MPTAIRPDNQNPLPMLPKPQRNGILRASSHLQFKLPTFEGPLDLLLHLIREHRIDIYDIPIAQITDQYLEYLSAWESLDLAVAGEYIVMAATLLEIKSRLLLPTPPPDPLSVIEDDPRTELVQKLLEYQQFQGAVESLRGWEEDRRMMFFRGALENPDDYMMPLAEGSADCESLVNAFKRLLEQAGEESKHVTAVMPRRRVSLRMKMVEILRKVRSSQLGVAFDQLFELPCARYEIVLTFLAVLELGRQHRLGVEQTELEGEIMLTYIEEIDG